MIFGFMIAIFLSVVIGGQVHKHDVNVIYKQKQETYVLQRKIKKLGKSQVKKVKRIQTFHGDEIANLGGNDVK